MSRNHALAGLVACVVTLGLAPPGPAHAVSDPAALTVEIVQPGRAAAPGSLPAGGLGDRVTIGIKGLQRWAGGSTDCEPKTDAARVEKAKSGEARDLTQAKLFIDDRAIPDLPLTVDLCNDQLLFDLVYTAKKDNTANRDAWSRILGDSHAWSRQVVMTVALDGINPLPVSKPNFDLVMIPRSRFNWWLGIFLVLMAAFLYLAVRSDLLRGMGPQPGSAPDPRQRPRKPFSLARCQMAWWLFVILAAYLFIGVMTGDYLSMTAQAVALLGVSAATAVGALAVDQNRRSGAEAQKSALTAEQTTLVAKHATLAEELTDTAARLTAPGTAPVAANDLVRIQTEKQIERDKILSRLNQIGQELKRLEATLRVNPASGNFLKDILSDATGVTLHRFQMLVWTVVLGIVFALQVYRNLAMMDFSPELLALQGISGGTYLGFKVPEAPASSGGPAT
jgi:hypothetical protein